MEITLALVCLVILALVRLSDLPKRWRYGKDRDERGWITSVKTLLIHIGGVTSTGALLIYVYNLTNSPPQAVGWDPLTLAVCERRGMLDYPPRVFLTGLLTGSTWAFYLLLCMKMRFAQVHVKTIVTLNVLWGGLLALCAYGLASGSAMMSVSDWLTCLHMAAPNIATWSESVGFFSLLMMITLIGMIGIFAFVILRTKKLWLYERRSANPDENADSKEIVRSKRYVTVTKRSASHMEVR